MPVGRLLLEPKLTPCTHVARLCCSSKVTFIGWRRWRARVAARRATSTRVVQQLARAHRHTSRLDSSSNTKCARSSSMPRREPTRPRARLPTTICAQFASRARSRIPYRRAVAANACAATASCVISRSTSSTRRCPCCGSAMLGADVDDKIPKICVPLRAAIEREYADALRGRIASLPANKTRVASSRRASKGRRRALRPGQFQVALDGAEALLARLEGDQGAVDRAQMALNGLHDHINPNVPPIEDIRRFNRILRVMTVGMSLSAIALAWAFESEWFEVLVAASALMCLDVMIKRI